MDYNDRKKQEEIYIISLRRKIALKEESYQM